MVSVTNATPLLALDAVVIDTETTGLDPRHARIVEIAAVPLVGGRLGAESFRSLVQPGEPIPPSASAIHGIDDAAVAAAPRFAQMWPDFLKAADGAVVIGHTIGFDLAVIARECKRAGLSWTPRYTLDTRLLAAIVAPALADHTIETLASWLGVKVEDRHSALGDAAATANIFRALVPKLREGGIRTLAEALTACRALSDALDQQHQAGWAEVGQTQARPDAERALRRIDSYPYRHRNRDVMRTPPQFIAADASLRAVLARLMSERISSLYVYPAGPEPARLRPSETGIVTERDALRAIAERGAAALELPVEKFMTRPLAAVPADAFVYRAIGRMNRLKVRHLGVTDAAGFIAGALSARDLLRLRAGEAVTLGDEIDQASDVHALGAAWARLPQVAASLIGEQVAARDVAAIVSRELGALTRQAAVIAEMRMKDEGRGGPPCAYAVAVLGSAGRGESLLAMDQDNAIVFAEGEPGGPEDLWFGMLGTHIADILHEVGVPYCQGGVMAKNAQWRGSVATWRARVDEWIIRSSPEDLLSVDIFFDLRGVHGDASLTEDLWRYGFNAAKGQVGFVKLLAEASGETQSALGLFGRFATENGRIDLKKSGLFGVVSTARVLAICHHVVERSTPARLAGLVALGIGAQNDLHALAEAQGVFLELILVQQLDDIERGRSPTNKIAVKSLGARDRERLRTALDAVRPIDDLKRDLLFAG
jgi:DNA polymerase-3 subunit epsilon/CBS domain-containing protein